MEMDRRAVDHMDRDRGALVRYQCRARVGANGLGHGQNPGLSM
jgi:hypothetical protein